MNTMRYLTMTLSAFLLTGCTEAAAATVETKTMALTETSLTMNLSEEEELETYDDATAVHIQISGTDATIDKDGAVLQDGTLTISKAGTYVLSGDGTVAVVINTEDKDNVHLVLNGVTLKCESGPAIYVADAEKTILTVRNGTKNAIEAAGENADEKKGGIYAKDDLVINGGGSLEITAASGDGIHGNDEVKLVNAMITIHAESDGIDANDILAVKDCILNITAEKDGIKAGDTDEDTGAVTTADIEISGGVLTITAADDGIQATGTITASQSEVTIEAGGGYENAPVHTGDSFNGMFENMHGGFAPQDGSGEMPQQNLQGQRPGRPGAMFGTENGAGAQPGMNSGNETMRPGEFQNENSERMMEPSADLEANGTEGTSSDTDEETSKGIKADGSIILANATVSINSADDALHANTDVSITAGTLTLKAGDDAIHADGTMTLDPKTLEIVTSYEGLEAKNLVIDGGEILITASDDGINSINQDSGASEFAADDSLFTMNGGTVTVDAGGDGVDCNGNGVMNGGTLTVYGPENNGNGALDYNGTFTVNGGTLLAGGSSQMAMVPSAGTGVYVINAGITNSNGTVEVKTSDGTVILTYQSEKTCSDLVIASDQLKQGSTYTITQNGTSLGEVTISDTVTYLNKTAGTGQGMFGRGRENRMASGTQPDFNSSATPEGQPQENSQLPDGQNAFPDTTEQKAM